MEDRGGRGGQASDVTLEYRIDGASKNKTGNAGDDIYVWEVKAIGQGDDLAQKDLAGYREDMAKLDKYKGKSIQPGFKMNTIAYGIVADSPDRATFFIAFDGPTEAAFDLTATAIAIVRPGPRVNSPAH